MLEDSDSGEGVSIVSESTIGNDALVITKTSPIALNYVHITERYINDVDVIILWHIQRLKRLMEGNIITEYNQ